MYPENILDDRVDACDEMILQAAKIGRKLREHLDGSEAKLITKNGAQRPK